MVKGTLETSKSISNIMILYLRNLKRNSFIIQIMEIKLNTNSCLAGACKVILCYWSLHSGYQGALAWLKGG